MYGLCKSCVHYRDDVKTPFLREPKHCSHPDMIEFFGVSVGGFYSGIDIFACSYHQQYDANCGDVRIINPKGGITSYVITKERKQKRQYMLQNNEQNIRDIQLTPNPKIRNEYSKETHPVDKNYSCRDSDTFRSSRCTDRERDELFR